MRIRIRNVCRNDIRLFGDDYFIFERAREFGVRFSLRGLGTVRYRDENAIRIQLPDAMDKYHTFVYVLYQ